jgi:hypothetical protein
VTVAVLQLLEAIQNSAFATFIRESPSLFAYTFVLSLHAMGLAIVVGFSAAIALRLLGLAPTIPLAPVGRLFPVMYVGFWINALSGLALLAASATTMLANPMFYAKLVSRAAAILRPSRASLRSHRSPVGRSRSLPVASRRIPISSSTTSVCKRSRKQ